MQNIWSNEIRPGGKWSGVIGKGKHLRFTSRGAGANLALLLYLAADRTERYNMPDTLKAQHTARLTRGHVLMSDNGRVLASIVEDSLGWHDPLGGLSTRARTDARYGATTYQELRNDWLRSGEENMAVELVRNGLGLRDLVPHVNLFSKVWCDHLGTLHYEEDHCPAGATVVLRTEMDVLVLLSNTPHPLHTGTRFPSVPVLMEVSDAPTPDLSSEYCRNFRGENRRAFENTLGYYSLA
ncbi:urea amidolyase associated protein UAAP1 [Paraflavisolibacter sp. H34]|uniref:urea amidolyase associated protein UAAP1 n=1 Tax=Huijunlia imazamoxiresistens TaxID=3127457 RepID=UPI003018E7C3